MEIYVGKQPSGPFEIDNWAMSVVKILVQTIYKIEKNVTPNNLFTSIRLTTYVLKNDKLTLLGI